MFERFTDRMRGVLVAAQVEATALGHDFLGTEHLLLGLLVEREGVAGRILSADGLTLDGAREQVRRIIGPRHPGAGIADADALRAIGIDLDEVRATVEASFGPGALDRPGRRGRRGMTGGPSFVPRAKKAMELSLREALALGHGYIGTEHLLLGILRLGEGVAYEILDARPGGAAALRPKVLAELSRLRPGA